MNVLTRIVILHLIFGSVPTDTKLIVKAGEKIVLKSKTTQWIREKCIAKL